MKNKKPTGQIIYQGPSRLDGSPIVVIAITRSTNSKTGDMVQTYVLKNNGERPTVNQQTGADFSICGDCKQRPFKGGACYVVTAQGPSMVYKSFLNTPEYLIFDIRDEHEITSAFMEIDLNSFFLS